MDANHKNSSNNNMFENIKSNYILNEIFDHLKINIKLKIIKYNKNIQNKLKIDLDDYIDEYYKTEIEIIPKKYIGKNVNNNYFIKIQYMYLKTHCHIYFNDDKVGAIRTYLTNKDNVSKIKIILDKKYDHFNKLFEGCNCIEKVNFIKCNRNDIEDLSYMFYYCKSLREINFSNFNANNINNIYYMFDK